MRKPGDDRRRLEALYRLGRLLAAETEVEPLAAAVLTALAEAAGRGAGRLERVTAPDEAPQVLATLGPPRPAAGPLAGELRIPLTVAGREVARVVLDPGDEPTTPIADSELLDQMAFHAAAALGATLLALDAARLAAINRAVLDGVGDGIGLVDDGERFLFANERMLDLAPALVDLPAPPDGGPASDEVLLEDSGRRFSRTTAPLGDRSGDALGRLVVVRDVTQERDVQDRKDELIATIAHELRSPLSIIAGFVGLMASRRSEESEEGRQLRIVHAETGRLQRLVDDLLDLERLGRGAGDLRMEPFDLVAMLEQQVELQAASTTRHRIELEHDLSATTLVGDEGRLAQVVSNLISNAIKYSPRGGVVRVHARDVDGEVEVSVADRGLGIDPAEQDRVFERFYRAGRSAAQGIPGTGLGLTLSRQIVLAHGGVLEVASRPGQGSTFTFRLPREGRGAAAGRTRVSAARPRG